MRFVAVPVRGGRAVKDGNVRRARVLVIDDEPLIAKVLGRMLGETREVTIAFSGKQALDVIERDTSFDVILCDLMMPEITGMGVYAELAQRSPELARKMVFMTGGAFTEAAADFLQRVAPLQIAKPFRRAEVEDAVAQVLAS